MRRRRAVAIVVASITVAALMLGVRAYLVSPNRGLPDANAFTQQNADNWDAFGGTWEVVDGTVRNSSDERGAKLLTGSRHWRNYSIEADVMLLGSGGDAGLILRSGNEEEGVDAYTGYYAGIRSLDDKLVLGRADYGWTEAITSLHPADDGVKALKWYHIKLLAYECQIAVAVSGPSVTRPVVSTVSDNDCIRAGRAGLRSYSSGGLWRNVAIRPVTKQDLAIMLSQRQIDKGTLAQAQSQIQTAGSQQFEAPVPRSEPFTFHGSSHTQSISSLRLTSFAVPAIATIRGSVVLTSPLVVQDSTGGVLVPHPIAAPPLKLGDQIEVTGTVGHSDFSSSLEQARVRVLWEGTPVPAVTVSATQAATGAFDATFVEVEGRLRSKAYGPDNTLVFTFDAGPQFFSAIMTRGRADYLFNKLKLKSLLRLRGVVVVASAYTKGQTPFVLLLPSAEDVDVLAGPPWWSARHLIAAAFALLLLALAGNFVYGRVERWRLRAVLEERERMAHEIHDTLAQSFAGIGFQLEAIRSGIPCEMSTAHQQLDLASNLVHHSHIEARRSIATLRPDALESEDLLASLSACIQRMAEGGGVQVRTFLHGEPRNMPSRISHTLFRIGQEAIANAIQHAHPSTIALSLECAKDIVRLGIVDDGSGFTSGMEMHGFGVPGMRKRAARIAAQFEMLSTPGHGTSIYVTAPIPPPVTWSSWPKILIKYLKEYRRHVTPFKVAH